MRRSPYFAQGTPIECGAACLAMVLAHYGLWLPVAEVAKLARTGRHGTSAEGMRIAAQALGFALQARASRIEGLGRLGRPLILHWGFSHWVVLDYLSRDRATIVDPAVGRRRIGIMELSDRFTGVVLVVRPSKPALMPRSKGLKWWDVFRGALTRRALGLFAAAIILLTLFGQTTGVALAESASALFNRILPTSSTLALWAFAAAVTLLLLIKVLLDMCRSLALANVRGRLDSAALGRLLDRLFGLTYSSLQNYTVGDLTSRVEGYFTLRQVVSDQLVSAAIDVAFVVVYCYAIFRLDRTSFYLTAVVIVCSATLAAARFCGERDLVAADLESESEKLQILQESLRAARSVKAWGGESGLLSRLQSAVNRQANSAAAREYFAAFWGSLGRGAEQSLPLLVTLWGALAVTQGKLDVGTVFALLLLASAVSAPIGSLSGAARGARLMVSCWARLEPLMVERPRHGDPLDITLHGAVEARGVHFTYPGERTPALRGVSTSFEPGSLTVIVGGTGSGKSTLISVLLGLFYPDRGEVVYDGVARTDSAGESFRSQIGTVLQDCPLFSGSIRENIAWARPGAPFEQIVAAAKTACVHDEIAAMPGAYETYVSEGGSNISGGQRQRIGIARALLGGPAVLILDEASSQLDQETAAGLYRNIRGLQCTRIVIAHDLGWLAGTDRILFMVSGEISEQGTHAELRRADGGYSRLLRRGSGITEANVEWAAGLQ